MHGSIQHLKGKLQSHVAGTQQRGTVRVRVQATGHRKDFGSPWQGGRKPLDICEQAIFDPVYTLAVEDRLDGCEARVETKKPEGPWWPGRDGSGLGECQLGRRMYPDRPAGLTEDWTSVVRRVGDGSRTAEPQ